MPLIKLKYHTNLANYFKTQTLFFDGENQKQPNIRKCMELPWQQTKAELWDDVTETLCDLDFIQAKSVAKQTYDLVGDFNRVLGVLPENQKNIEEERTRQVRLDKYTRDLIAYAKGEKANLDIIPSIDPWTHKKISIEIDRIYNAPTKLDLLNAYLIFITKEFQNIHNYSHENKSFVLQQALNSSTNGPLVKHGNEKLLNTNDDILFISHPNDINDLTPFPLIIQVFKNSDRLQDLKISFNGNICVGISMDELIIWELNAGVKKTIIPTNQSIETLDITPDGEKAVIGNHINGSSFWNLTNKKLLEEFRPSARISICIFPDSQYVLTNTYNAVFLWDIKKDFNDGAFIDSFGGFESISVTSDKKKAVACDRDNNCFLFKIDNNKFIRINTSAFKCTTVDITPTGNYAFLGSSEGKCMLWNLSEEKNSIIFKAHKTGIIQLKILPDAKKAITVSESGKCTLWNLSTQSSIKDFDTSFFPSKIRKISVTPDCRKILATLEDGTGVLLNIFQYSNMLKPNKGLITPSKFGNTDSRLLEIYSSEKLEDLSEYSNDFSVSDDGEYGFIMSNSGESILMNLKTKIVIEKNKFDISSGIRTIQFSRDNNFILIVCLNSIVLYYPIGKMEILTNEFRKIKHAIISPDGKLVAIAQRGGKIALLNLVSKTIIYISDTSKTGLYSLTFHLDGRNIIYGTIRGTLGIIDFKLNSKHLFKVHSNRINTLSVTPDGLYVISASWDKTICLFDLKTYKIITRYIIEDICTLIKFQYDWIYLSLNNGKTIRLRLNYIYQKSTNIVTAINFINPIKGIYEGNYTICSNCLNKFETSNNILKIINSIYFHNHIQSNDSPCLKLSNKAWEDPRLNSKCPKCGKKLKFNPFIAGGEY